MAETILSVIQAGEQLGVSDHEIRRYIREGRLPASRKGQRSYRIKQSDLDAFKNGTLPDDTSLQVPLSSLPQDTTAILKKIKETDEDIKDLMLFAILTTGTAGFFLKALS